MRRKGKIYIFLTLFAFTFAFLGAQNIIKIGVVDSQKILYNSNAGKEVLAQLDKRSKQIQDELQKKDKEISDLENKLTTQRLTLSPDALEKLGNDLQKKRTERQRFWEDSQRDLLNLRNRLFNKIRNEVLPIIQEIGKEKGYTLIVDLMDSGAIYWDKAIDITDEVINRYNKKKAGK
jgi:outer membrane protein